MKNSGWLFQTLELDLKLDANILNSGLRYSISVNIAKNIFATLQLPVKLSITENNTERNWLPLVIMKTLKDLKGVKELSKNE